MCMSLKITGKSGIINLVNNYSPIFFNGDFLVKMSHESWGPKI